MPNNYLSVLYQHIIQVENKNVGLKVEGHKHTIATPPVKKVGGAHAPLAPPPASYASVYIYIYIYRERERERERERGGGGGYRLLEHLFNAQNK